MDFSLRSKDLWSDFSLDSLDVMSVRSDWRAFRSEEGGDESWERVFCFCFRSRLRSKLSFAIWSSMSLFLLLELFVCLFVVFVL